MPLIRLFAALAALYLPAVLVTNRLFPDERAGERAIWASTIGLASLIFVSVAFSYLHLYVVFAAWAVVTVAALWWRHGHPVAQNCNDVDWWLVAILAVVAAPRFIVIIPHELPPGWDPTFHLVLARKIVDARGMIYDWRPFEDVTLNYPLGSHSVVAVLALASGLQLHTTFNLLVPILGVLTTAQIYLVCLRATTSREAARYAAVAYGLWANWGSIDYYRWGGMPNLLAMSLLLGALALLLTPKFEWRHRALFGLLVASIFLTHHHVMMTAGCILVALLVYYGMTDDRQHGLGLLSGVGIALVVGSFYIVPYAVKGRRIGATSVLTASEPSMPPDRLVDSMGSVLLLFASSGVILAVTRRSEKRPSALVGVVTATLAALFIGFQYIYPTLSARWWGEPYVAFTPSRFLTDLVYVLSIFAGYAVYRLRRALRVPPIAALIAALLLGLTQYSVWQHLYSIPTVPARIWQAYKWIEQNTDPDAIVLDGGRWSVYGTWRRTAMTSLPVSEPSTEGTAKHRLIQALEAGRRPPRARLTQVVAIRPTVSPGDRVLWRDESGLAVVELWGGHPH